MSGGVPCHFVRRVMVSPFILMVLVLEAVSRCALTGFCGSGLPREDRPVEKGGTHGRGVKSTGFFGTLDCKTPTGDWVISLNHVQWTRIVRFFVRTCVGSRVYIHLYVHDD